MILECYANSKSSLLPVGGEKTKNGSYVKNLLDTILLLATLAIIKVPGHSKLDSLKTKGIQT